MSAAKKNRVDVGINKTRFEAAMKYGTPMSEAADYFRMTQEELDAWIEAEYRMEPERLTRMLTAKSNARLRKAQWDAAEKGNATMMIWLGKNQLGQSEKAEESVQKGERVMIVDDLRNLGEVGRGLATSLPKERIDA